MPNLIAIDVAILPPRAVSERAVVLSAALPALESEGLRLDQAHLPHITLLQQFIDAEDLDFAAQQIDDVLYGLPPIPVRVTGATQNGRSIWLSVARTAPLESLHEELLDSTHELQREHGTVDAFFEADARDSDVTWVTNFRKTASLGDFAPHITLGHAADAPSVPPLAFEATTIALCHLGRFCTCRRILRQWTLSADATAPPGSSRQRA